MTDGGGFLPERERANYIPKPRNVETYVQQERIRTIHFGIGAIGAEIVRAALNNPNIEIVGAVDPHPAKAGRDLGEPRVSAGQSASQCSMRRTPC